MDNGKRNDLKGEERWEGIYSCIANGRGKEERAMREKEEGGSKYDMRK